MVDFPAMSFAKILKLLFIIVVFTFGFSSGFSSTVIAQTKWVASWATSPQLDDGSALKPDELRDGTLRQIVHLSLGGVQIRLHISNRYGKEALRFTSVHVAKAVGAGSAKIVTGSDKEVLFSGKPDVAVPEGADYISDTIDLPAAALSDLAITLRVADVKVLTGHPGSRANSFFTTGNTVSAEDLPEAKKVARWS